MAHEIDPDRKCVIYLNGASTRISQRAAGGSFAATKCLWCVDLMSFMSELRNTETSSKSEDARNCLTRDAARIHSCTLSANEQEIPLIKTTSIVDSQRLSMSAVLELICAIVLQHSTEAFRSLQQLKFSIARSLAICIHEKSLHFDSKRCALKSSQ